ncbi:MAG: DNA polymerase III subunit beta [Acholeplasmatales bacterium]|nr:DNA polymerase III subunit beta [Acholeplasmatales bacterium]
MKLTIDREIFLQNLNVISRGLPLKSPLPILTCIKMDVTESDIYLTSSNADISVEAIISDSSLKIEQQGSICVDGQLIDVVRKADSKEINLFTLDDNLLFVKAGSFEAKLPTMDYLEYPNIDYVSLDNPFELNSKLLKELIKTTSFASSTSEKKPILTGVNFNNEAGIMKVISTDSYRLAQNICDVNQLDKNFEDFNLTVPAKSLNELIKIIDNFDGQVALYFSNNKLLCKFNNIRFQTRLLEGNYPSTSKLIKDEYPINISFNKDELLRSLDKVSVLSPKDSLQDREITYSIVKIEIMKDRTINISTSIQNGGGTSLTLIPTKIETNEQLTIGLSSRYLIDALKSFNSIEVTLSFKDDHSPFIVKGNKENYLTQLILPVRI